MRAPARERSFPFGVCVITIDSSPHDQERILMNDPVRVGVVGLGTVGSGVVNDWISALSSCP